MWLWWMARTLSFVFQSETREFRQSSLSIAHGSISLSIPRRPEKHWEVRKDMCAMCTPCPNISLFLQQSTFLGAGDVRSRYAKHNSSVFLFSAAWSYSLLTRLRKWFSLERNHNSSLSIWLLRRRAGKRVGAPLTHQPEWGWLINTSSIINNF